MTIICVWLSAIIQLIVRLAKQKESNSDQKRCPAQF